MANKATNQIEQTSNIIQEGKDAEERSLNCSTLRVYPLKLVYKISFLLSNFRRRLSILTQNRFGNEFRWRQPVFILKTLGKIGGACKTDLVGRA